MGGFAVILPAAGRSTRFGDPRHKKIYTELDGRAVWLRAVEPFLTRPDVVQIILAIAGEDREMFESRYRASVAFMEIKVIEGGDERHETVARAIEVLEPGVEFVAVHDAARPCVPHGLVDAVFAAARDHGAAVPGLPVADTLRRRLPGSDRTETVSRADLFAIQTPQAFRRDWLTEAYARRASLSGPITDDAQLIEALGHPCHIVPGSPMNLKITTPEDMLLAGSLLEIVSRPKRERSLHPFADDRERDEAGPVDRGAY